MAIQQIPFKQSGGNQGFSTVIDSIVYFMNFYWNDREAGGGAWYFDVLDANRTPIRTGLKIATGAFLGNTTQAAPFTTGVFAAIDTSGANRDAGYDDLGSRVQLFYIPVGDLLAANQTAALKQTGQF
jgi:hypothetical protein